MKTLATLAIAMGLAASSYAQGQAYFNFDNNAAYDGTANSHLISVYSGPDMAEAGAPGEGAPGAIIGSDYSVGFVWAPGTYTTDGTFYMAAQPAPYVTPASQSTVTGDVAGGAGIFDGGAAGLGNFADGTMVTIAVRAWYDPTGTTSWSQALMYGYNIGGSEPIPIRLAAGADPIIADLSGMTGFAVGGIPEPSTLALAGLGAALLIIRRRK